MGKHSSPWSPATDGARSADAVDACGAGRDNRPMSSYWPTDDGWPYPDSQAEVIDVDSDFDDDLLAVRERAGHLLDGLEPLERTVVSARFGLDGQPARSMKELHAELGLSRQVLGETLGSGLAKLRHQLTL